MKKLCILFFLSSAICQFSSAQIAINMEGSSADASAMLDVSSMTKGLLIPRMSAVQKAAIVTPATGLLVHQADFTKGIYFNTGSPSAPEWTLLNANTSAWQTAGNSGTNTSSFTGTLDNQPFRFRVDNTAAGFVGTSTSANTSGDFTVAFGANALYANTIS